MNGNRFSVSYTRLPYQVPGPPVLMVLVVVVEYKYMFSNLWGTSGSPNKSLWL